MITIKDLLRAARADFESVVVGYLHPTLFVVIRDKAFIAKDEDEKFAAFLEKSELDAAELGRALSRGTIRLLLLGSTESHPLTAHLISGTASHWLPLFDEMARDEWVKSLVRQRRVAVRALHFYGFKGGQARTTILAMLAKALADSGYKVLVVDADLEAPSLHRLFGLEVSAESSTLAGLLSGTEPPMPASVYASKTGSVDLLPAAPTVAEYAMDYAAITLRTSIDVQGLKVGIERLRSSVEASSNYDVVLFDHRTGISSTVLPVMEAWPGSTVIATRKSGVWEPAVEVARTLLAADMDYPGAFVSFSLDPDLTANGENEQPELAELIAEALRRGAEDPATVSAEDAARYIVHWYHDRAFLGQGLPDVARVSQDNKESLQQLREVLGISSEASPSRESELKEVVSPSGALDSGWFIETPNVSRLLQPSSQTTYVFGRKGTGKTRLYRELVNRGLGFALHAAADYPDDALVAQSTAAAALLRKSNSDYEMFWWALFSAGLRTRTDRVGTSLAEVVEEYCRLARDDFERAANPVTCMATLRGLRDRIVFLVDGVETAVRADRTKPFIEALFRFISTLQNDGRSTASVQVRLFLRPDLAVGIQNIEQQIHGRKVDLRWDVDSIFNYVLSEIARANWFRQQFPDACRAVGERQAEIQAGALNREAYEELLLRFFPIKLRRNNLLTMTFLRTYFSDAAGDVDRGATFYPRAFGSFLRHIAERGSREVATAIDESGRVSHALVLAAFEFAAKEFINDIKQELYFALELAPEFSDNQARVDELIQAFSGLSTPFDFDKLVVILGSRLTGQSGEQSLRDSLRKLRELGLFEIHPGDATKWRAGRLFKEGLGMKYVR